MVDNLFLDLIRRGGLVSGHNQIRLFKKIRFSMYPARAFSITIQTLYDDNGLEYVKQLARINGKTSAIQLRDELFKLKKFIKEDYQIISNLIQISGFGVIDSFEEKGNSFLIKVSDHHVILPSKKLFGKNSKTCDFFGEIYSSYIEVFENLKKPLKVKHTKCICKGDKFCEWVFEK